MSPDEILAAAQQTGPVFPFEATFRLDVTSDPRQDDYPEDSQQWIWLFAQLYDRFGVCDLLGALTFLRCHEVRVVRREDGGGYRLGRGLCPPDVYEMVRQQVLVPHGAVLARLLREMQHRLPAACP